MTSEPAARLALYEELLRRFASGVRATQLYAPNHPLLAKTIDGMLAALARLHQDQPTVTIGILENQVIVEDTPLVKASTGFRELIERLCRHEIERMSFHRGITEGELITFMAGIAALTGKAAPSPDAVWSFPHISVGRLTASHPGDGIAGDMATIRRLYGTAVAAAEAAWETTAGEGMPDVPAALYTVEGLADAVVQNRTALVALTAMRNYDNYTFTHMVNVSILTMGQAQALGIEGRLLREFGLSALMHDIGKVRTPHEILNKSSALTGEEMAIMRRHTVDGAEILRRTPEMPILAPVVAFEHHLRLDGSGYPEHVTRATLNVATMMCSIADVYDAMRSQRSYQQAFPTDRILAVLERNDGTQFDQHLVRRFVQLLGIYPPGTLVRLSSGEVAVVTRIHAPDPFRPRVKVLFGSGGERHPVPFERNLWEPDVGAGMLDSVVAPLDPDEYDIDPLNYLQP